MTCSIKPDELSRYILGDAEPAVETQIREHLDGGCPSCADEMRRLSRLSDLLDEASSEVPARTNAWASIQAQMSVGATSVGGPAESQVDASPVTLARNPADTGRSTSWSVGLGVLVATACSFLLVTFALQASKPSDQLTASIADDEPNGPIGQDFAAASDDTARRVSMRRNGRPNERHGSFLVDGLSRQLHLHAADWTVPANDERFVIWFVTADDTIIEGDHLDSLNTTSQLHLVDLPDTKSPVISIAVTIEKDNDWSSHQKQPAMAAGSKLKSASFVSDDFGDLLRPNI